MVIICNNTINVLVSQCIQIIFIFLKRNLFCPIYCELPDIYDTAFCVRNSVTLFRVEWPTPRWASTGPRCTHRPYPFKTGTTANRTPHRCHQVNTFYFCNACLAANQNVMVGFIMFLAECQGEDFMPLITIVILINIVMFLDTSKSYWKISWGVYYYYYYYCHHHH